jgi:hypothetical protein
MSKDLPSWASKAKPHAAQATSDPSLPSWAGAKNKPAAKSRQSGAVVVASTPEHHRGILGTIGHIAGQTGTDLYDVARHSVGGAIAAGSIVKDVAVEDAKAARHPLRTQSTHDFLHGKKGSAREKLGKLEADSARGTGHDLAQPFRHPGDPHLGNFGLAALGIASLGAGTVARGAEAARAAEAASGVSKAAAAVRGFREGPNPGMRTFTHDGVEAQIPASRNAFVRKAQRQIIDPLRQAFPDVPVLGSAATVGRASHKALLRDKSVADAMPAAFVAKAKAAGMLARNKKLGKPTADALAKQHALRVVAEGVPVEQRLATHNDYLNRGYNASAKTDPEIAAMREKHFVQGHNEQIGLNEAAAKWVRTVTDHEGVKHPRFTKAAHDAGITEAYEALKKVTGSREGLLAAIDKLSPEGQAGRLSAPGREFFYADPTKGTPTERIAVVEGQIRRLEGLQAARHTERAAHVAPYSESAVGGKLAKLRAELAAAHADAAANPEFTGGEARIPTVPAFKGQKSKAALPQIGPQNVVNGTPQGIPSIYKPYLGKPYKAGKIRNDVVRLVAEAHQEAQRYWTLVHVTDRLKGAAKDFKTSEHDIPIRVDEIPGQPSLAETRVIAEDSLNDPSKLAQLAYRYESLRQRTFPDAVPGTGEHAKGAPLGSSLPAGYKWVDSRLLGGLNQRNPLLGFYNHKSVAGVLKVGDAINNASKLAILYLKPAYVAPNLLGNVGMNLVQQGFAAPANLGRAARLNAALDADTYAKVLHTIGEGFTGSLEAEAGRTAKLSNAGAHFYGNVLGVDKYPRLAAFLFEARKLGYSTPENLRRLYTPEHADDLSEVAQRMNAAMIDYGDLNAFEQGIVRRAIFFYPWVKGATRWSVRFVTEHSVLAATAAQAAKLGKERQQQQFPFDLPSWAEGLVPAGDGATRNPASLSVLSTPADVASSIINGKVSDNLPPSLALALGYRHPIRAVEDQARSLPTAPITDLALHALGVNSHIARPSKTFPQERTPREALLLWLLGSGLVKRETNPDALMRSGYLERVNRGK